MKEIVFLGDTQSVIREWSEDVRKEIGHQLFRVQNGFNPEDFKPHKTIGMGYKNYELRLEMSTE